jgi:hypothetical protein
VLIVHPRQLAGEGSLFDSLFSDTDNGVGYGVENAEDNIAEALGGSPSRGGGTGGSTGGNGNPPPPPPPPQKRSTLQARQGDKIANGAAAVLSALGQDQAADIVETDGDNIDGQLTEDAATAGQQFGGDEENILESAGNLVPNKLPAAPKAGA